MVAIDDLPDSLVLDLVLLEFLAQILPVHRHPIGDRAAGQIIIQPVHVSARIGHPRAQAKCLGDVEPPLLVDAEGDRIGQQRLGREQLNLQAGGYAKRPDRTLALVGSRSNGRIVGLQLVRTDLITGLTSVQEIKDTTNMALPEQQALVAGERRLIH